MSEVLVDSGNADIVFTSPVQSTLPSWAKLISEGGSLAMGQWSAIPNSIFTTNNNVHDLTWQGSTGGGSVAWSGVACAYDEPAIYYFGGGHDDYRGNEIYRLSLTSSPTWTRKIDASTNVGSGNLFYYPDGKPASFHTIFSPCYDIVRKRLMYLGCFAPWTNNLSPTSDDHVCSAFDIATSQWVTGNNNSESGTIRGGVQRVPAGATMQGASPCSDPVSGDQYMAYGDDNKHLHVYKWSTTTQVWTVLSADAGSQWESRGVIGVDPSRNEVWGFNLDLPGTPFRISSAGVVTRPTLTGSASGIFTGQQLAAAYYIPTLDSMVVMENSNNASRSAIYLMNCATLVCTQVSTTGSVPSTTWGSGSLYRRFHYVPLLKGAFVIPQDNTAAYFVRLHP